MTDRNRYIVGGVLLCLLLIAASCNDAPPEETPAAESSSAASDIASADQSYSQREDLMQIRRGIVSLRQALTKDPGNFDAAWKLSKFNYYLATHTDDSKERDDA